MAEKKRGDGAVEVPHTILREGEEVVLRLDFTQTHYLPSIEDSGTVMAIMVNKIAELGTITRIILYQKRDYEYDFYQTQLLVEVAKAYKQLVEESQFLAYGALGKEESRYAELRYILYHMLKNDPLGAYVEIRRIIRHENLNLETAAEQAAVQDIKQYLAILQQIAAVLDKLKIITLAKPYLPGYRIGDRSVYRRIFRPVIKPDFMFTKLMSTYPVDGEEIDNYEVNGAQVTIFRFRDSVKTLYHLIPPEFRLSEEQYEILDEARRIMAEHKPKKSDFTDPERMRDVFYNVGYDLIKDLVANRGYRMKPNEIQQLANILVRYTIGFGLVEVLLGDDKIQDISVNSPMGQIPIFIVHEKHGDCYTNIIPTQSEADSWSSKLRIISGRPLDEANPLLDTEIILPNASSRVSAITQPLDPTGTAFSFRRHRDKPWTLPLFIKNKMLTPLAAGLISFCIDGTRTLLIAGTRSSGKTSFLGGLLVELMRRYRVISVEDTLELPTTALRKLGYNIQPMKVRGALALETGEMSASDGIRATLRLGDSALIVGEVRSKDAIALYEAMRVGAAANVVAGTIHSDSPYGVFDRVVNDIGIPATSFKATDLIIVANPIVSADGLHKFRRITQITEVRKDWEKDPLRENGFVDLMKYDAVTDTLEPSDDLINGNSDILKTIASKVRDYAGNWEAVWDNILLRAKIKQTLVEAAEKTNDPDLLEADFVVMSNDVFHQIMDKVKEDVGTIDAKRVFFEWNDWLKREIKKRGL